MGRLASVDAGRPLRREGRAPGIDQCFLEAEPGSLDFSSEGQRLCRLPVVLLLPCRKDPGWDRVSASRM